MVERHNNAPDLLRPSFSPSVCGRASRGYAAITSLWPRALVKRPGERELLIFRPGERERACPFRGEKFFFFSFCTLRFCQPFSEPVTRLTDKERILVAMRQR